MLSAAAAALGACNTELGIDEQTYQCATDADCGDGLDCWAGQCADATVVERRCDEYCGDFMQTCNERLVGPQLTFANPDECEGVCETYPINGTEGDESGNTLECRRHHLELAKLSNPISHCAHASPRGKNWCGETTKECLLFCYRVMETCTGEHRQFDIPQTCLGACQGYEDDGTLACRMSYVEDARRGFEVSIGCENAASGTSTCEEM